MSSLVSLVRDTTIDRQQAYSPELKRERVVLNFISVQLFVLIYAQKISLFGDTAFALGVPMLVMFAGVAYMVVTRNLRPVRVRLAIFMLFLSSCLLSEALSFGSVTSLLQLILLYACMVPRVELSYAMYRQILNRYISFMILPACIVFVQFSYQKVTGLSDPFNIELIIPKALLTQGFFYNAHIPWDSPFSRPNGFFFLEPSFVSAFLATATILEIAYFRRFKLIILMAGATCLSMGDTGIGMLVIATPFLLSRQSPPIIVAAVVVAVIALILASSFDVSIPLLSRVNELSSTKSSSGNRLSLSFSEFTTFLFNPSYLLTGDGAGSAPAGQFWPMLKLLREYGLLATVLFVALYIQGMVPNIAIALRVSLSIIYHFTGGYLLNPIMVELIILFLFTFAPVDNNLWSLDAVSSAWAPRGLRRDRTGRQSKLL